MSDIQAVKTTPEQREAATQEILSSRMFWSVVLVVLLITYHVRGTAPLSTHLLVWLLWLAFLLPKVTSLYRVPDLDHPGELKAADSPGWSYIPGYLFVLCAFVNFIFLKLGG